jgi:glycosyltransferase involved in cell wall biosynthesis
LARADNDSTGSLPLIRLAEVPIGINVIGHLRSETGVGEASRRIIAAARAVGLPVSIHDFTVGCASRKEDLRAGRPDDNHPFQTNVFVVNADQTEDLVRHVDPSLFQGRYNIGVWNWELEDFPDQWRGAFRIYDEIWTPSAFTQDAISRRSPIPVVRMPYGIDLPEPRAAALNRPFQFLTMFDTQSVIKRKNPEAVLESFQRALSRMPGARLVLKINNGGLCPQKVAELRQRCADLPVSFLDGVLSREEITDLLAAADCFVSLHRSEGFGFGIAEAMWLGKPVIVTAYSGNLDFTRHDNSFLVGWEPTRVGAEAGPYAAESHWAEPDVSKAAELMALVFHNRGVSAAVAKRGRDYVRARFSLASAGALMLKRLEWIYAAGALSSPNGSPG